MIWERWRRKSEFIETPRAPCWCRRSISNPLLRVADIPEISKITRAAGAALIVDNTFGTPYLQRPLELGADISRTQRDQVPLRTRGPHGRGGGRRSALRGGGRTTTQARRWRAWSVQRPGSRTAA